MSAYATRFTLLRPTRVPVDNRPVERDLAVQVFDGVLVPRGDLLSAITSPGKTMGSAGTMETVDAELFIEFRLNFLYSDQILSLASGDRWRFVKDFDYGSTMRFWLAKERVQ